MTARVKKLVIGGLVVAALAVGGSFAVQHFIRMGVAADVTRFTPADAEFVFWVPRLDETAESVFSFTRGIQEASRLRELFKAETGVDLGTAKGMREVGIDPEAGLVVFVRNQMVHLLLGVEDAAILSTALDAKFANLGYSAPKISALDEESQLHEVMEGSGKTYAAFGAQEGLMVIVYRQNGEDPSQAVRDVLAYSGASFFDSARFKSAEAELGSTGPLLFAAGETLKGAADAQIKVLDAFGIPPLVLGLIRPKLETYVSQIDFAAARLDVNSCAAAINATLKLSDEAKLAAPDWKASADLVAPKFGQFLPRDTVLMIRLGFDAAKLSGLVTTLTSSLANLGNIFGLGGDKFDPLAAVLAGQIHPDLVDRHLMTDVVNHISGHLSVAVLGLGKKAKLNHILKPKNAIAWLSRVKLAAALQLKDPQVFWDKWWAKREVLGKLGFELERLVHPEWHVLRLTRNCKRKQLKAGQKRPKTKPICERYGVILQGDTLIWTTGRGTLERIFDTMKGQTGNLAGLTREAAATAVLESGPLVVGGYFSFDGLLKAIANRNLPGGATRYLAQMYEFAFSFDSGGATNPAGVQSQLLLTR
ncbi:MAG: hypothetical protein ACI9OJ_000368 [Myxococcota bacterium]